MKVGSAMSATISSIPISSHHRLKLAAVVLRGELTAYETTPIFRATVDRLIDELLESYGALQETDSWDDVTDRIVACYAHRLPGQSTLPQQSSDTREVTRDKPSSMPRRSFDGWGTVFMKRVASKNYL